MPSVSEHLRASEDRLARLDGRLAKLKQALVTSLAQTLDAGHLRETLLQFDPLWGLLHPQERIVLVQEVIASAVYRPESEAIELTLRRGSD